MLKYNIFTNSNCLLYPSPLSKLVRSTIYAVCMLFFCAVGGLRWRSSYAPAPSITAAPVRSLVDEQINIKAHFLPPHSPVTACAQMHSEDGDLWEAFAHYNTNADGTVSCELCSVRMLLTPMTDC